MRTAVTGIGGEVKEREQVITESPAYVFSSLVADDLSTLCSNTVFLAARAVVETL